MIKNLQLQPILTVFASTIPLCWRQKFSWPIPWHTWKSLQTTGLLWSTCRTSTWSSTRTLSWGTGKTKKRGLVNKKTAMRSTGSWTSCVDRGLTAPTTFASWWTYGPWFIWYWMRRMRRKKSTWLLNLRPVFGVATLATWKQDPVYTVMRRRTCINTSSATSHCWSRGGVRESTTTPPPVSSRKWWRLYRCDKWITHAVCNQHMRFAINTCGLQLTHAFCN